MRVGCRHTALKSPWSSSSPTFKPVTLSISETHLRKWSSAASLSAPQTPVLSPCFGAGRAPDPRLTTHPRAAGCATTGRHWHCDSRACSNFYQVSGAFLFPAATTLCVRDSENVQEAWDLTHSAAELSSVPPPLHPRVVQPGRSRAGWEARRQPQPQRPQRAAVFLGGGQSPHRPAAPSSLLHCAASATLPGAPGRISCHFLHSAQALIENLGGLAYLFSWNAVGYIFMAFSQQFSVSISN